MNPSWVNFYYVKPDLLIKLFEIEIELSGDITVLDAIALTVYKETSQQVINLPPELSIIKESDLPSYVLIWQMNCFSLSLRFRLAISELPYFGMYVYYRPSFEAVVGRKEIKTPYNVTILSNYLSLTLPVQGAMDTAPGTRPTPFSTSLGRPDKPKKYEWMNKCKWSVIISLIIFHGKFALTIRNERILWIAQFTRSQPSSFESHQCFYLLLL